MGGRVPRRGALKGSGQHGTPSTAAAQLMWSRRRVEFSFVIKFSHNKPNICYYLGLIYHSF